MQIQTLKKTDSEIFFLVKGITPGFANLLRRAMMVEVPTLAIEWVDFIKNDSVLPDEILANRLGLIPLTFDKKAYNLKEECDCKGKGCSRCQVKLFLSKKGPCMVYAGDLRTKSKDVKPIYENIPIVELFEDEELEFEAIACLGFGKDHVKWQASVASYKNCKIATVIPKDKNYDKYLKMCERNHVFKVGEKIVITGIEDCPLCQKYKEISKGDEVRIDDSEDIFVFHVETTSGLRPEEIVLESLEQLKKRFEKFKKEVKKIK